MFRGFYNLTSGMLTHGRALDVISNNMTNVATAGFKSDRFTSSTFEEVMWNLVGNRNRKYTELGEGSWITAPSRLYTDYTQGSFDETELPLDFAIEGAGYFAVEVGEDERIYTRGGGFALDNEGYLALPGQGRVLSALGEPIQLLTDRFTSDESGTLTGENGRYLGRIGVFTFEDETLLEKNDQGLFVTEQEPTASNARVMQGMLERSNVDWVQQMTEIYDDVINRATTEVGRLS